MRVFWFTNCLMPSACKQLGVPSPVSGSWMWSLAQALTEIKTVQLAIATVVKAPLWRKKEIDGIVYYTIPFPKGGYDEINLNPGKELLKNCLEAIEDFVPDLLHVHGTEYFYGSLSADGLIQCPTVVSLQGLIKEYAKVYWGGMSFREVLKSQSVYNLMLGCGLLFDKRKYHKRAKYMEQKIIKGNHNFIGRTLWDKAHLSEVNPTADYYHCDLALRLPFHSTNWKYEGIHKYSIFTSSAHYPLKGFHWLLKAVAMLKQDFPEISVRVGAAYGFTDKRPRWREYETFLHELIDSLGLKNCVFLLGELSAEEMAKEMSKAHAVVIPSMVENECTSLSEAMLVGAPCVASLAGGMTTTIEDRKNALGFPAADAAMLAECLRRIFIDKELVNRLSRSAQKTAEQRHDKKTIAKTMLQIYEDVIKKGS